MTGIDATSGDHPDAFAPWTVIWDLGGVMLEWSPPDVVRRSLGDLAPDDAAVDALTHTLFQDFALGTDWSEFDRGTVTQQELCERLAARSGVPVERVVAMVEGIPASLHRKPDSLALSRRLRAAGHRVLFLSNMPAEFADGLDADAEFRSAFDDGLYSARLGLVKPEPAIFDEAARRFGLAKGDPRVVYLDDRPVNLTEPEQLGWVCLVFTDAAAAERDLVDLGLRPSAR